MSILIVSGTNRPNSQSFQVAKICQKFLDQLGEKSRVHSLEEFCEDLANPDYYQSESWTNEMVNFQDHWIFPAVKFIFVIPEYNGGFPGALKLWLDVLSVRNREECFAFKKFALIGISEGKSSNIRGLDHFLAIARYFQMIAFPKTVHMPEVHKTLLHWNDANPMWSRLQKLTNDFSKF
ncbi:MAG: NAD(P)H-dependent oxidoreductase [Saprospiraceae bacterium]|nr:NAD(P)H-dependent oxidoreductase [Saprospiraceae bacterium]